MSFVPEEELKEKGGIPLAPMIDFLFLLLAFFVSLTITRNTTEEADVELVKAKGNKSKKNAEVNDKIIHIAVLGNGEYRWCAAARDYPMSSPREIADELKLQYSKGLLPEDKAKTLVLLKIDKNANWEPILKAILAVRECGFEAKPLYIPEKKA